MKVLVAMSGGVDSSVAAAMVRDAGHEVVGVTMRLWGGASDTGCCSVSDTDDARRLAHQLGVDHLVFNFAGDFANGVVAPYVDAHAELSTPNPCIECNRTIKFARLAERADDLGFDAIATGHHARVGADHAGRYRLERGADRAKDQSYVLHMLGQTQLAKTLFPVGELTKREVRAQAAELGLGTATKPDSQDVCFITSTQGRRSFLADRIPTRAGRVVDTSGRALGTVAAIEMITIGQRHGLGLPGGQPRRYVVDLDAESSVVVVGDEHELASRRLAVRAMSWVDGIPASFAGGVLVQSSAHGAAQPAGVEVADEASVTITFEEPQRRVAPGQSVVLYDVTDARVLGGGIARRR